MLSRGMAEFSIAVPYLLPRGDPCFYMLYRGVLLCWKEGCCCCLNEGRGGPDSCERFLELSGRGARPFHVTTNCSQHGDCSTFP